MHQYLHCENAVEFHTTLISQLDQTNSKPYLRFQFGRRSIPNHWYRMLQNNIPHWHNHKKEDELIFGIRNIHQMTWGFPFSSGAACCAATFFPYNEALRIFIE
jgi:hypothetical protein